jgi:hypothetical protein
MGNLKVFSKISPPAVDDPKRPAIFAIPLNAGLHQSKDRGSWFSHILGLQIGTQFCPAF